MTCTLPHYRYITCKGKELKLLVTLQIYIYFLSKITKPIQLWPFHVYVATFHVYVATFHVYVATFHVYVATFRQHLSLFQLIRYCLFPILIRISLMGSKWLSRGYCFKNCMVAIMTYRISVTQMTTDVLRRSHNAVFVSTLMIYHSDLQTSNMTGATNGPVTVFLSGAPKFRT